MDDCTSPGADKFKRSRASKPKVKTGCLTCKFVPLFVDDKAQPRLCKRCQKFGHQCDGYSKQSTTKASNSNGSRTLVPKSPTSPKSPDAFSSATVGDAFPQNPSQKLFQNEREHRSFQHFCSQTLLQLSTYFNKELWTRLMLQACESSPSIRKAIIEIGALDLSSPRTPSSEVGTLRHQRAFRRYNKSICMMPRDVAGGRHDLRTTLIACLLFYCFESFHGYHELAVNQVYTGLKMIREWTTSFYRPNLEGKPLTKTGSETPYTVEDDILRAFGSLEIQVMSYTDGRKANIHEHYRHAGQTSIDEMPPVFHDLPQARALLELVIRRSMHWLRSTMHLHNFSAASSPSSPSSSPTTDGEDVDPPLSLFFDVNPTYEEQSATLREYERWDKAFQPLLTHARSRSACQETFLRASTLRLHWLSGYLSIASNNSRHTLVNDGRFTRELKELVDIARILLRETNRELDLGVVFDMQIIVPLMTVGWVYRHRALRREAIQLLLRSPRKEGVWDGYVVGRMMAWLADIEEERLSFGEEEEEYVPEWAAARCIKMGFDTERREAHVSCLQPVKGSLTGEEIKREMKIPW
ncbi:Aspercryptin biosynthesis cluster-specific transcription regulator atnN [Hyphodiscus hymeniophilus]|uniref:Aspercryptin biosynthesis cluster-specific transcription regulator atnN n=1 Tax=Hyphodiscus hymeniophilus TaxID=353542 RepID=A0A9P6VPZ6_9HELO|nr:Aspercryptin biosynthesis cluster-specific transcription regulator atnN [Hyphodiscus hymeniophilus]